MFDATVSFSAWEAFLAAVREKNFQRCFSISGVSSVDLRAPSYKQSVTYCSVSGAGDARASDSFITCVKSLYKDGLSVSHPPGFPKVSLHEIVSGIDCAISSFSKRDQGDDTRQRAVGTLSWMKEKAPHDPDLRYLLAAVMGFGARQHTQDEVDRLDKIFNCAAKAWLKSTQSGKALVTRISIPLESGEMEFPIFANATVTATISKPALQVKIALQMSDANQNVSPAESSSNSVPAQSDSSVLQNQCAGAGEQNSISSTTALEGTKSKTRRKRKRKPKTLPPTAESFVKPSGMNHTQCARHQYAYDFGSDDSEYGDPDVKFEDLQASSAVRRMSNENRNDASGGEASLGLYASANRIFQTSCITFIELYPENGTPKETILGLTGPAFKVVMDNFKKLNAEYETLKEKQAESESTITRLEKRNKALQEHINGLEENKTAVSAQIAALKEELAALALGEGVEGNERIKLEGDGHKNVEGRKMLDLGPESADLKRKRDE